MNSLEDIKKENMKQNEEIRCIHSGILTLQGVSFRAYCKGLLEEDHEITMEEFETC